MKHINVLWTGGLDSTFRILELSREDVEVQPYYVIDRGRKSVKQEKRAMRRICKDVVNNPSTKCKLLPVVFIKKEEIAQHLETTEAWKHLHDKYELGIQYDWLARFALANGLQLEVGLEKSNRSKAVAALTGESQLQKSVDGVISVMTIDKSRSTNDACLIFGNLMFPASLWNCTKEDEVEKYIEWGYDDTVKKTWFCHDPILGLPCGQCHPCQDALNEGMAYRLPWGG